MKLRRIYISLLTLTLAAGPFYSCRDYLEINPVSSFGPDYVFSNVNNATTAILGVYASLGGDQAYGIRLSMYYPYDNDEMMGQGGEPGDNERRDIARYTVQPSNTQLANPFNQLYAGIEKANLVIYHVPQMDKYENGSELEKRELRRIYGEALTLRAQFYLELIRNWGDLPAQFLPSSLEEDLFKEKTDRDEIYARLLDDLALAGDLVPWKSQAGGTNERISKGAVKGLRARIALTAGGFSLRQDRTMQRPSNYLDYYQIARQECLEIMNSGEHGLNMSFQAVFKDALCAHRQEPTGEIIWEVGMWGGSSATGDSKLGYYNGPRVNNLGNSALAVLPTAFYDFDPNDLRRDVSIAPYNINADGTYVARRLRELVDGKFRRDWITNPGFMNSNAQYFGVNWPLIRYSDILLMFAEAENEINGPTGEAVNAFEQVRIRGFGGNASLIGNTPLSKEEFFNAIVMERKLEFLGEGIRKFDLVRWNLLGQKLEEERQRLRSLIAREGQYAGLPSQMYYVPGQNFIQWTTSFYTPTPVTPPAGSIAINWINEGEINNNITNLLGVGFTPGRSELLPLPTTVLDANPMLRQDYGY